MNKNINQVLDETTVNMKEDISLETASDKMDSMVIELPIEAIKEEMPSSSIPERAPRPKHLKASSKSVEEILQELISKPSQEEKAKLKLVQEDIIRGTRIKKTIELPKTRKDRRKKIEKDSLYEKRYDKKKFNVREKNP